jgi:GNAT superfamily N-acetyltransferase
MAHDRFEVRPAGSVCLRPATRADLPVIVAMRDELNDLELTGCPHAPIIRLSVQQFTALWGHTFESSQHCWRVVEEEGRPVGFGLIYLMAPPTRPQGAYLHWAYLRPGHRQRGTGRRLFDELANWARQHGVERIELQFIEGNELARQFWTKVGFRPFAAKCVHYLGAANNSES